MNKVLVVLLVSLSISLDVFSSDFDPIIDSPHGLFSVSKKGVTQIRNVGEKDEYGNHKIEIFVVKSVYSEFRVGEMTESGWWSPFSQQFYVQVLSKAVDGSQCKWWEDANWSHSYIPMNLDIGGKIINAYGASNNYKNGRKPKRICENYRFYTDNCERVRCNSWEEEDAKAGSYLIRSKDDALSLLRILSNQ